MKLTTKLLIITLLALSFFMTDSKNISQTDTYFTVASEDEINYEQINNYDVLRYRSLETFRLM